MTNKQHLILAMMTGTVFLLLMGLFPAYASSNCYTAEEAEAEQGIRIHSELMVIGLNCQHMAYGGGDEKNLYLQYREFTHANVKLFAHYEDELMTYFERTGIDDPEAALNELRTNFANKISTSAASMRPDVFCYYYAPRLQEVSGMSRDQIRRWAATPFPGHPVSQPVCEQ